MIKLTVLSSESTETMKKQNNEKDEFQQKESTPLLVHKSKTLQHRIYYNSKLLKCLLCWTGLWVVWEEQPGQYTLVVSIWKEFGVKLPVLNVCWDTCILNHFFEF